MKNDIKIKLIIKILPKFSQFYINVYELIRLNNDIFIIYFKNKIYVYNRELLKTNFIYKI